MNWAAVAAIAAVLGVLVTVMAASHISGRLTQKISDLDDCTTEHARRLDDIDDVQGEHAVKIGRLEEWKNGYNAAARTSGMRDHHE